jgi:hypothetical protein
MQSHLMRCPVTRAKALICIVSLGFVMFVMDVARQYLSPGTSAQASATAGTAVAAGSACPIPPIEALAREWRVTSVGCTTAACKAAHFSVGDKLIFEQDISGAKNFSVAAKPLNPAALRARTEGYELRSDGIGNAVGPIVLDHNPLDGTTLQLHWMIVRLRSYDANGLGLCKLHALAVVCDQQPADGSSRCDDHQHGGDIHLDP